MPSYIPTGRTRTISANGTFDFDPGTYILSITNGHFFHASLGFDFGQITNPSTLANLGLFGCGVTITADSISGIVYIKNIYAGWFGGSSSSGTISISVFSHKTGTFSFSCDMEEVSSYTYGQRTGGWQLYERPKAGGTISGTITFAGQTYSFSHTLTASDSNILNSYGADLLSACDPGSQLIGGTAYSSVTAVVMGQTISYPYTQVVTFPSVPGESATLDTTNGSKVSTSPSTPGQIGGVGVGLDLNRDVTRQVTVQGQINAFDIAYPTALVTEWVNPELVSATPTTFSLGDTISIENYYIKRYRYADGGLISLDPSGAYIIRQDGRGIQCRINSASLTANGEKSGNSWNTALNARLKPFDALTIWQDSTATVDPVNSTSGWSANVSVSGGHLVVDSSSLSGVATRTFSPAFASEGYRYLEVDVTPASHTGGTLTLTLTDSSAQGVPYGWQYKTNLGASGVLTTCRFDLLAPYGNAFYAPPSSFTSKVLDTKQTLSLTPSSGPGWGIDLINYLNLSFPASTGNYAITAIRLVRDVAPKVSFIQSSNYGYEYPTGSAQWWKYSLADTDGKRSLLLGDLMNSYPYTTRQISAGVGSFSAGANAIAGWHIVPNVSAGDMSAWYFDWNLGNLCGGGVIYTGSAPTKYWFDQPITVNPTQLQIQARAQSVIFPPQCGDLVNGAGYGTPFKYYTWEFLRGRTTGIAIDNTQAVIAGQTVTETEVLTGNSSGSDTTNSAGRFLTGANYAKTKLAQKDTLSGVTPGTGIISFNQQSSDILRISYNGLPSAQETYPYIIESNLGQLHMATVFSGDVIYQRTDQTTPINGWATAKTITAFGDVQYARIDIDPELSRIHILVSRKTSGVYNVYWLYSDSDGADFTNGGLVAGNALGASVCCLNISATLFSWFVYNSGSSGPGTMQGQFSQGSGQAFGSVFTFKDNTGTPIAVADQGWCNVEEAKDYANRLVWCPILNGHSTPTVLVSADNGLTWGTF